MERPKRQYKSKYFGLTQEEYDKIQYEKNKERRNKLTEEEKAIRKEKRKEWLDKQPKEKLAQYSVGKCDVCGKEYTNIYEHYKTKKHIELVIKQEKDLEISRLRNELELLKHS
jgi:hypothetical protein